MNRILILYYSGVNNTKRVSHLIYDNISDNFNVDIYSIEKLPTDFSINNYKSIIIGFPTIHSSPSKMIINFLNNLSKLKEEIPTFIFTTCGLYPANSLRIFGEKCIEKNILPIINKSYRCCATDGILLTPFMKYWFFDEKNLELKIIKDVSKFIELLKLPLKVAIPKFKLYTPLNYPNKLLGQNFSFTIYLHKDQCIKCNTCIVNCPTKAFKIDELKFPSINKSKCINCYRCIHHCPKMALSLSKRNSTKKTLFIY